MGYDPGEYWSRRLEEHPGRQGAGHLSFGAGYNRWLSYRKAWALHWALPPLADASILDVGSGAGWVVDQLEKHMPRASIEGCDIAPAAVERLRRRFADTPAVTGFFQRAVGFEPLPREDAVYDIVTMLDVAHHITDDAAWRAALADVARVLKPGGHLVFTDGLNVFADTPAAHVKFRSRREWTLAAHAVGMELDRSRPLYRWLSRPAPTRGWNHLPGTVRGATEFALEWALPRKPHTQIARLRKDGGTPTPDEPPSG